MNHEHENQGNLIDTTDCLETVGVFRGWKNFLFVIVFFSLLLSQTIFWLVNSAVITDTGYMDKPVTRGKRKQPQEKKIEKAAEKVAESSEAAGKKAKEIFDPNTTAAKQDKKDKKVSIKITRKFVYGIIRAVNFIFIPAAVLYCLTMMFILKVSMVGRLGGMNHISRAFFLSLIGLVIAMPWQLVFGGAAAGTIYTPTELMNACPAAADGIEQIIHYLRFTGLWVVNILFLIFAQRRSCKWTRATLKRLDVI